MKACKYTVCIALSLMTFAMPANAIDLKEGCSMSFTCNSNAPEECDNCTGYGWLHWTRRYTNCTGTGYNTYTSCDGQSHSGTATACYVADGETLDVDVDYWTYGAVWDCDTETCENSSTQYSCHWDVTVHDRYEAEATGSYEAEFVRKKKDSAVLINGSMVSDQAQWTKGGSSTLTLGGNAEIGVTIKKILEAKVGFSIENSWETNWSSSYTHIFKTEEVGKYGAPFYVQERGKRPVRYREWTCSGPGSWTNGYAYKGHDASVEYITDVSPAALDGHNGNTGWLSSDSTTLSGA